MTRPRQAIGRLALSGSLVVLTLSGCGAVTTVQQAAAPSQSAGPSSSPSPASNPITPPAEAASPTGSPSGSGRTKPPKGAVAVADPQGPVKVAKYIFPAVGSDCGSASGNYTACADTPELAAALHENGRMSDAWCRCQNTFDVTWVQDNTLLAAGDRGNPDRTAVAVEMTFGSPPAIRMALLLEQLDGYWVAYDTYCGSPSNNMLSGNAQPCP